MNAGGAVMQFKEGSGWKACYNEEKNIYTASFSADGLKLYEIKNGKKEK